jgi:putative endonuclease
MPSWFYLLRLRSALLYAVATTDLKKRYEEHLSGKACRTTTLDAPVSLVYSEKFETFSEARRREAQIKRWSRAKKEALVSGDLTNVKQLSKSHRKSNAKF